jgi:hypothetical protein
MDVAAEIDQSKACQSHLGSGPTPYFDRAIFHAEYCDSCLDIVIEMTGSKANQEVRAAWRKLDGCKLHLVLVRDPVQSRAIFLARNYPCCLWELAQAAH